MEMIRLPLRGHRSVTVTLLPSVGANSDPLSRIGEYLRACFEQSPELPPSVGAEWKEIRELVDQQVDLGNDVTPETQGEYFSQRLELSRLIVNKVADFRNKYADYMSDKDVEIFGNYSKLARASFDDARARMILHNGSSNRNASKRLTALRDGVKLYGESLPPLLHAEMELIRKNRLSNKEFGLHLTRIRSLCIEVFELTKATLAAYPNSNSTPIFSKDLEKSDDIERIIKAIFWDVSQISQGKEPLDYVLVNVDGVAVAVEHLSPDAKAIERIKALDGDLPLDGSMEEIEEWYTSRGFKFTPAAETEVDEEALLESLRKRGVKI
jgi:hypothetical protein